MASTGVVLPTSLEDVIMRKIAPQEESRFSRDEQRRMRLHEAYLFNEQQNAEITPVEESPGMLSKVAKSAGDVYATALSNVVGGPIGAVLGGVGATAGMLGAGVARIIPQEGVKSEDRPSVLDVGGNIIRDVSEALTYQPRTKAGKFVETAIQAIPHAIKQGAEFLGDLAMKGASTTVFTKDIAPEIGATVATVAEIAGYALGDKTIRTGIGGLRNKLSRMEQAIYNNEISLAYERAKTVLADLKAEDIAKIKARIEKQVTRGPELIKSTQRIDELYNDIQSRDLKGQALQNSLREIKTEIRRNIETGQTTADAMRELGLRQEQIDYLEPRLKNISVGRPSITGGAQRGQTNVETTPRPISEIVTQSNFDPITGMPVTGASPVAPEVTRASSPPPEIRPIATPQVERILPGTVTPSTSRVQSTSVAGLTLAEPTNVPPGRTTQAFILDEMAPMGADRIIPSLPPPSRAITGGVLPEVDPITGRSRASEVFLPEEVAPMGADRIIPDETTTAPTVTPVPSEPIVPNIPPSQPEITSAPRVRPPATPEESARQTRLNDAYDILVDEETSITAQDNALRDIKKLALEVAPGKLEEGLRKLGLDEETISDLLPKLKAIRANKIPTKATPKEVTAAKPQEVTPVVSEQPPLALQSKLAQAESLGIVNRVNELAESGISIADIARQLKRERLTGTFTIEEMVPIVRAAREATPSVKNLNAEAPRAVTLDDVAPVIAKLFDAGADESAVVGALTNYGLTEAESRTLVQRARELYMQDKIPGAIAAQASPSEVVKKPRNLPAKKSAPTLYENYQNRVRELNGLPHVELSLGDHLRQNYGIILDEPQFNAMVGEVSKLPRDTATFNAYIQEYVQRYRAANASATQSAAKDYISVINLDAIDLNVPGGELSKNAPVQLLRENGQIKAVVINERNLNSPRTMTELLTEAERLTRQGASGDVIQTNQFMQAKLQAKADLFSLTPDEAARLTTEEMQQRIYKLAAENNWEVNKLSSRGIKTVPREVVEASAKLNDGAKAEPKNVSSEDAAAYMAEQANEVSTYTLDQIWENLANGVDISADLPPKMAEYYTRILDYNLEQLTTPHRRSVNAMLKSLANLFPGGESPGVSRLMSRYRSSERGSLGDIRLTPRQRQAFNELKNDAIRIGRDFMELVRRDPSLNAAEKALLEEYNRSSNVPPPKPALELANMPIDVGATLRNDPVIKRAQGDVPGTYRPSIYRSEFEGMANANDLTKYETRGTLERITRPDALRTPTRVFREANIEWLLDAYHEVERSLRKEKADTNKAISRIERQFSGEQKMAIMGELLRLEGSTDLITKSGINLRPLNAAERTGAQFIRQIFEELFPRAQAMRVNVGKAPMDYVPNYVTHMRSFNIDNAIGTNTQWWQDKPNVITERMSSVRSTPFPYEKTRRGGKYSVEVDAFKVLRGYVDKALDQIHLGPFVAKVHELIDTNIANPTTNKTWSMKKEKPVLQEYLKGWSNYIAGVPEQTIPPMWSGILYSASRTLGSAYMSFNPASTGIQLTSLIPTGKEVGLGTLTKASIESIVDILTPGQPKRKFRNENSSVLDTRNMDIYFDEVGRGIVEELTRRIPRAGESVSRGIGIGEAALTTMGTYFLRLLDSVAAAITWDAGYAMALKAGKVGKEAFRVADNVVTRTQGSSLRGDRAPIQRTQLGRAMTQFQTFAINNWDFLTSDVLGIGNKNMTNLERAKAITYMAVTGAIVGSAIEYFTGNNPFPNPPLQFAKTAMRGQGENQSDMNYAMELFGGSTLGEILKVTPVTSAMRSPKGEFLGPVFSYGAELGRAAMGAKGTNLPRTAVRGLVPGGLTIDEYLLAPEEKSTQSFRSIGGGMRGMKGME